MRNGGTPHTACAGCGKRCPKPAGPADGGLEAARCPSHRPALGSAAIGPPIRSLACALWGASSSWRCSLAELRLYGLAPPASRSPHPWASLSHTAVGFESSPRLGPPLCTSPLARPQASTRAQRLLGFLCSSWRSRRAPCRSRLTTIAEQQPFEAPESLIDNSFVCYIGEDSGAPPRHSVAAAEVRRPGEYPLGAPGRCRRATSTNGPPTGAPLGPPLSRDWRADPLRGLFLHSFAARFGRRVVGPVSVSQCRRAMLRPVAVRLLAACAGPPCTGRVADGFRRVALLALALLAISLRKAV